MRILRIGRCGRGAPYLRWLSLLVLVAVFAAWAGSAFAAGDHPVVGLRLAHLDADCGGSAPVTFGQPFRDGDVPAGARIVVRDGEHVLPTQTDVKARNPDGSVRHAVITVAAPCGIDSEDNLVIAASSSGASSPALDLNDVLESGFDSRATFNIDGERWHLSARDLLARIAHAGGCGQVSELYCRHWLDGPLAGEWVVGAPPVDASGKPHPDLMVFFAVRAYGPAPVDTVRVDTVVENDWAYAPDPHNLKYSAIVSVPGQPPYRVQSLTHYRQARWHHVSWWGQYASQPWFAALNGRYLQATPAVPSYQDIELSGEMLSQVRQACAPMDHCDVTPRMEATGAQPQIGPLPQWSSAYIVNPHDYRAYRWMLANSDALGAYSVHYRSKNTYQALSVARHPCATLIWPAETSHCKVAPHADDRLPHCEHDCHLPLQAEPAHHGAPAYVAYLVTGDWYYEQELNFWADWVVFYQNQAYRGYRKGLVHDEQVRGQAWSLRTLGDAAWLLPDEAPLKTFFNQAVAHNIAWYNARYADNPQANPLGFLTNGYAVIYPASGSHSDTGVSTWQLSFFTWAAGNLADMGFDGADRMRDYFSRFQLGLLTSPGFCPELASAYYLRVRETPNSPYFTTFSQVYDTTFPHLANIGCSPERLKRALPHKTRYDDYDYPAGTMVGYPDSDTGFVANFQIGLASAVDTAGREGRHAWSWFMARPVRPDYRHAPQFGVVPSSWHP
ncbi:hypothetical protein [Salinisphaera sp.]|uniref:RIFT barrel domain-containing protein n=1 Tax=Salinisphaera sp. TaxID=1914330 RepID=UPI002D78DE96|nr:hypothetical protein [Salinisphaera sp.]HET7314994.1 hypothetical protein [Salinisphaera sp.]